MLQKLQASLEGAQWEKAKSPWHNDGRGWILSNDFSSNVEKIILYEI